MSNVLSTIYFLTLKIPKKKKNGYFMYLNLINSYLDDNDFAIKVAH